MEIYYTKETTAAANGNSSSSPFDVNHDSQFSFQSIIQVTCLVLRVLLIVMTGCVTSLGILLNSLIVLLYLMNSVRNTIYNLNILHLALCDLLSCLTVMLPYHLELYNMGLWDHVRWCRILRYLHYTFGVESSFLVIIISVDRLLLVTNGTHHRKSCTRTVAIYSILLSWGASVSLVAPMAVDLAVKLFDGRGHRERHLTCEQFSDAHFTALIWILMTLDIVLTVVMVIVTISTQYLLHQLPSKCMVRTSTFSSINDQMTNAAPGSDQWIALGRSKSARYSLRHASSLTALIHRSREIQTQRIHKAHRLTCVWCLSFLLTWTPYSTALVIDLWSPGVVPGPWLYFLMWVFLAKHAADPFLYARYISAFRRRFEEMKNVCEHVRFLPSCCLSICCLFCCLSDSPRMGTVRTFDALKQRLLQDCADENSTTSSFHINQHQALDYLWRDPRIIGARKHSRSYSRHWNSMRHMLSFSYTHRENRPPSMRLVLPILMTSTRFSNADSSRTSTDSTLIPLSDILSKQFTCKTSSISCDSFNIVDEREFQEQQILQAKIRETEV